MHRWASTLSITLAVVSMVVFVAPARAQWEQGARLVDEAGRGQAVVLVPEAADPLESAAAQELIEHLAKLSDEPPVQQAVAVEAAEQVAAELRDGGQTPILLGALAHASLRSAMEEVEGSEDAFVLQVREGVIRVAGVSPRGTLNGTYELLEQLGFRWFMPGELGRTLPLEDDAPVLAVQETVQAPSFPGRKLGDDRAWVARNRLGGVAPPANLNMPSVGDLAEYPERHAWVNGQRIGRQLCVSNPDTLAAMIEVARAHFRDNPKQRWLTLGTHGGSHCECSDCRALDPPGDYGPFSDGINVTDRYVGFANRVLEGIEAEFPDRRISLQFASGHVLPPVNERGGPNLDIVAWTVGYCRIHGVGNPVCTERMMVGERTAAWVERIEGGYYERTEWGNVAGPGFLFPLVHRYRRDLPTYHAHGGSGFHIAPYSNWASENPSAYIGARLLWNHDVDVDALLDDFYRRYYGPAAEPMRAYHELIETTAENADHHTGTALDMPHIYTAEVREQARMHLDSALALVDGDIYAQRLSKVALALDYLDAFVEMMRLRDRHDYAGAAAALERAHEINDRLRTNYEIPLLTEPSAQYLDRFFGDAIREANHRTSEGGVLVAALADRWAFQIDPEGIGEELGLHRAETTGGNWQSIQAWSSSWSNQGLRYYRGDAWYRQAVEIPGRFAGQKITMWVGGVDERARVWVNGQLLGDSPVGAFRSFEFDATDAVRPGEQNVVVICAGNHETDEVGTGGLLAPVMFYTPTE